GVEADSLSLGEESSLDRPFEVRGLERTAVRVLQALAKPELVDLSVPRDGGHGLCQPRYELVPGRPVDVLVRQQRLVDVPHRLPRLAGVRLLRIEVVDRVEYRVQRAE